MEIERHLPQSGRIAFEYYNNARKEMAGLEGVALMTKFARRAS